MSQIVVEARDVVTEVGRRIPITVLLSFAFVALVLFCAIFGNLVAPRDPNAQNLALGLSAPSGDFLFGTNDLGQDVFSRTIVGARSAVIGPILIALGAMLISNFLGVIAGYRGGLLDGAIMRLADFLYALPPLLVAIVVVGVIGGSYWTAIVLLIVLFWPYDARIVRGATLEQRPLPYVEAARILGLPGRRIMTRHIWPNIFPFVVANTFLDFAYGLVTLSALTFLGLGVAPGAADWGRMLADSLSLLGDNPAAALAPGGMIVLTAASMNVIGDWFYDWFLERGRAR